MTDLVSRVLNPAIGMAVGVGLSSQAALISLIEHLAAEKAARDEELSKLREEASKLREEFSKLRDAVNRLERAADAEVLAGGDTSFELPEDCTIVVPAYWQDPDKDEWPKVDKRSRVGKVSVHDFRAHKRVKSDEPADENYQVEEEQEEQEENLLCTNRVL